MPFRYLRDPLFLVCVTLYFGHFALRKFDLSTPFLQAYLNDLICLPFWLPMMAWGARVIGWRWHDRPPQGMEILVPLVLWSVLFEGILPVTPPFIGRAIADPNDIVCYALGGLVADLIWRWHYRPRLVAVDGALREMPR